MSSKHCPKCGRAYGEEAQICEDCEEALVGSEAPMDEDEGPVALTTVSDTSEALVLKNVLEAEGIEATIEDWELLNVDVGLTPGFAGGIRIMVHSQDAEAALDVLDRHRRGELALEEDKDPEDEI